ncbi:MAG: ROK family protein [Alphaproteobacteria bacterium]|nr:ROK family protein [Alphaproteobacteria bacterium]
MRIGIDLGGTKIEAVALDRESGRELLRRRRPTPRAACGAERAPGRAAALYQAIVQAIVELVGTVEREIGRRGTVGVGIPGAISPATGLVKNANTTCLIGHALDRDLGAALGRPVRLANDANCFALSEATDGAAAGAGVVFGVIIGTGCGGGLVVGGRVLAGHNAVAGEWGHNPLPWPDADEREGGRFARRCWCGKWNCIETFVSGPGLAADYRTATGDERDAAAIAASAASGHAPARAALERHADRLARALATIVNVVDPDVVVLGGGVSNLAHLYREVPARWGRYAFTDQVATALVPPKHGDSSGVRGAAWLWPAGEAAT